MTAERARTWLGLATQCSVRDRADCSAFAPGLAVLTAAGPRPLHVADDRIAVPYPVPVLDQATRRHQSAVPAGVRGFDNRGVVTGSGRIEASLNNTGAMRVSAGPTLQIAAPGHTSSGSGSVEVRQGGELQVPGTLTNEAAGAVHLNNAAVCFADGLVNAGQVPIGFGGASVFGKVNNRAGATVVASGGSNVTFCDTVTNDAEIRPSAGLPIAYFGPVDDAGSYTSNGSGAYHRFEGGYAPGHSPAKVSVDDAQFASLMTMELGSLLAGAQYDQIHFSASALFGAGSMLDVTLIDGFPPGAGDTFALFTFASAPAGRFSISACAGQRLELRQTRSLHAGCAAHCGRARTDQHRVATGGPERHGVDHANAPSASKSRAHNRRPSGGVFFDNRP